MMSGFRKNIRNMVDHIKVPSDSLQWSGEFKILFSGFKSQEIVALNYVIKAVEILPDFHLTGLRSINYDPERKVEKIISKHENYGSRRIRSNISMKDNTFGKFHNSAKGITLYKFIDKYQFLAILYHEIGHYVYYNILNGRDKKKWVNKLFQLGKFLNAYSSKNGSEDFAESYACYIVMPDELLKVSHEKYAFFHDIVFKNFIPKISVLI